MRTLISLFQTLMVIFIVAGFLFGGYYLLKQADIAVPLVFQPVEGVHKVMSMDGFTFTRTENGRIAWRVEAKTADLLDNKEASLHDVEINFTNPEENKKAKLTGDIGSMNTVSGNASIRSDTHDVRIVTSDGYVLTTASLFWKAGERTVTTPDPFKLIGTELYLDGKGISANVDMQSVAVHEHVKAVLLE